MREYIVPTLFLFFWLPGQPPAVPASWKIIKDAKSACQIAVPPEWTPLGETSGAVVFHDSTTAIAVVTSQPGQDFKPLTPTMLGNFGVPRQKMFENSAKRLFFQDKTSAGGDDPNAFSASVPAKNGTCSCHVVVLPTIPEDTAKKITLSLQAVPDKT